MLSQQNIKISLKLKTSIFILIFSFVGLCSYTTIAQNEKFKVILDPGHGGKDPGTLGKASFKNSYESDIALKVAIQVGKMLSNNPNYETIFTRKTNVFIPLHKRGSIANKADADLFISIHCNSAVTNAYGTTTYVLGVGKSAKNLELSKRENDVILLEDDYEKHYDYDPNSYEFMIGLTLMQEDYQDKSIEFAQIIQNKFVTVAKRKNRGVNQGNLAVLYDSYMPSVLIEIGFLSNKVEEKFLHTKNGQYRIAKAIYEAIRTYKKRMDSNSIFNANTVVDKGNLVDDKINESNSYYKIQIATSNKKIATKPNNFKKLKEVERVKTGSIYKYYYGRTNNLEEARKFREEAKKLGYKDAYIKRILKTETVLKKEENTSKIADIDTSNKETLNNTVINPDFYFSVQFAMSRKKIPLKPYNFKGLKDVTRKKVGNIYKYFYSVSNTIEEAKIVRKKIVKLGYTDAFVKKIKTNNAKVKKTKVETTTTKKTNDKTKIVAGVIFKVQVSSGKRKILTKSYNFRGLKSIERIKIGSYYKYYYGKTNDYILIKKLHKEAIKKGYKDAKIVAIKNNKLISVISALYGI